MDYFNLYPRYMDGNQNDYSSYMMDPVPQIMSPSVSVALPYTDPYSGTQSYIARPVINLNPENKYRTERLEINTPDFNMGITGRSDQLVKLMDRLKELKSNPSDKDENQDVYRSLSLDPLINQSTGLSPLQQQMGTPGSSIDGYIMVKNSSTGDNELVYTNNGVTMTYNGSGVMIFSNYNNSRGRHEPAVILFKSSMTGKYEELGGKIEMKDFNGANTLVNTAAREAREESANLFNITNVSILNPGLIAQRHYDKSDVNSRIYRCYALYLSNNDNASWKYVYTQNANKLKSLRAPNEWLETNDVQFFYLSDLDFVLRSNPGGSINCVDAEGVLRTIEGRTKACVREMMNALSQNGVGSQIGIAYENPHVGTLISGKGSGFSFLDETNTVMIK